MQISPGTIGSVMVRPLSSVSLNSTPSMGIPMLLHELERRLGLEARQEHQGPARSEHTILEARLTETMEQRQHDEGDRVRRERHQPRGRVFAVVEEIEVAELRAFRAARGARG